jgi:enoyl-CoA hydratase
MSDVVLREQEGRVAILTINRPEKMNALNLEVRHQVLAYLGEIESDDSIGVVVITGAGEKSFIAGADIGEFEGRSPIDQRVAMASPPIFESAALYPKPIIAMINGFCLGGGCELAMSCDIRVASSTARFSQPEINLGLIPGGGGTQRMPRLTGFGHALRLVLSGDMISAQEAKEIGLVELVYEPDDLREKTLELAGRIASKSPLTLRVAKQSVRAAMELPLAGGLAYERDLFCLLFSTEDKKEGVEAFLQKRPAEWTGR